MAFSTLAHARRAANGLRSAHSLLRPTSSLYSPFLRTFSTEEEPREVMEYDVVVVGAGPAGLSTAIKLKQSLGDKINVCVVEKGAEVGAHILSGACVETHALEEIFPDWKEMGAPLHQQVLHDRFVFLTENSSFRLPTPPQMHNEGNYIISLGNLVRWLGQQAEDLGVEIYPGFAAAELVYTEDGRVKGIATGDMGIAKDGSKKDTYMRGMELHAKHTFLSEGCRGSLSKMLMKKFDLNKDAQPQTYGLGVKEIWEVPEGHEHYTPGLVEHTIGWPMDFNTYGGSWMYHLDDNKISVGFVVGLDYKNPYLSPFQEFQRFKTHPFIRKYFEGCTRVSYGARTLIEGGLQSQPKLNAPGASLIGDSAGFLNVPKIKGTHCAMKSGILAADALVQKFENGEWENTDGPVELENYPELYKDSWLYKELHSVRNIRPGFHKGLLAGMVNGAIDSYLFRGHAPWTLSHHGHDHEQTGKAADYKPIDYPKPDNVVSFDILTSLALSGTNHDHDQPAHLKLLDANKPHEYNLPVHDGPEGRFCPAKVYEYVENPDGEMRLHINAQNCLHCKACDIKDPLQNINWTVPEGGGGPAYENM